MAAVPAMNHKIFLPMGENHLINLVEEEMPPETKLPSSPHFLQTLRSSKNY
jgi:hypothetical protein